MKKIWTLEDQKKEDEKNPRATNSYTGGEVSGLALENLPFEFDKETMSLEQSPENARKLHLYKDGFQIDDGEFKPFSDPKNKHYLSLLQKGQAPVEILGSAVGDQEVISMIVDNSHAQDNYSPSKSKPQLFKGQGFCANEKSHTSAVEINVKDAEFDPNEPYINIQLRFHDGQRTVQKFNKNATVKDLYDFVSRCSGGCDNFELLCGFPPSPIDVNRHQTLVEASNIKFLVMNTFQNCLTKLYYKKLSEKQL